MAADYTRNIVFNVNDKAIKRATDRITRSLTNIEKTLQRIESKGFNNLAKEVDMTSKKINQASKSVNGFNILLRQTFGTGVGRRTLGLGILGGGIGINKAVDDLNNLKRTASTFLPVFGKSTAIATTKVSALSAALSKLGAFAAGDPLGAGALAVAYMIFGDKIQELALKAGGAAVGAFASLGKKAFEASTIGVAGFKQLNQEINITTQAALKMNTLLARQNAMRGNVLRNIGRSQAARRDSDFLGFSQDADFATRTSGQSRRITSAMMQSFPRPLSADGSPFIGPLFDKNTFVSRVGRPAGFIGPDRPGIQDPVAKSIRRNQAKRDKLLERELKIRQNILKVEQQSLAVSKSELQTTSGNAQGFIGPRLPRGFRLKRQFAPGGALFNNRGAAGRFASAGQSALIGGAFPLLFGQGGLGAAAGGIGGAIGGALSPGLGFGLSIAGTAIAQRIQETIDFQEAVEKLNISIKATGGTSLLSSKQVREFGKSLGLSKDEALEALKAFKQFDAAARITLTTVFGKEQTFDTLTGLKNNQSILNALPGLSKELSLDQAKAALEVLKSKNAREAESFILDGIINKQRTVTKEEAKRLNFFQRQLSKLNPFKGRFVQRDPNNFFAGGSFMDMDQAAEFRGQKAEKSFDQKVNEALQLLDIQKEFNNELERQAIIKAPVDELNKLLDPLRQIDSLSKSIGDSFAESFKGIVSGSMTAQEALRNLFQRTADHFLDMAAQILAAQVRSGIMGLFNFNKNKLISSNSLSRSTSDFNPFEAAPGMFFEFANGGRPPVGRPSIVGEKGPELFVPDRAGTIIPNNQLGGMAGAMNVIVNVDASGSSVEGDEQGGRELGRLISVAIQSELIQQKRPGGLLA